MKHPQRGIRPARLMALLAIPALLLSACATPQPEAGAAATGGVPLAQAGDAVLEDPRDFAGPSTATVVDAALDPVVDRADPTLPAVVTDAQGTQVTIEDTSRILALDIYGTLARTVYELGLGDSLVGRDTSSAAPELADLPLVTSNGHDLNAEAILALEPSVIVTDTSLGPWDVILQMREAGIPVVVVDADRSVAQSGDLIRTIGEALGVPDQGEELAQRTEADIAEVAAEIEAVAPDGDDRLGMAFLYVRGTSGVYYLFGGESGAGSLISAIGGRDVATEAGWGGMRPVTDEGLIAMQPEVVLVMTAGLESTGGIDGLLEAIPALALTPAGENRRIIDMNDAELLSFGPITPDVMDALAVAVYAPEAAA